MHLNFPLPGELESSLRAKAAAAGQDIRAFVLEAIADKLEATESLLARPQADDEEWAEQLQACIALHPDGDHPVDDSRESIYGDRGT